jgi:pyruvate dehydrogenase E2 component (dihydrolipoamide acetyltransferase)
MHASLAESAQLTQHSSFDATDMLNFRKDLKSIEGREDLAGVSITDIIVFAVARVLMNHKSLNAHFLGDKMAYFHNAHIGVAVDTPRGLLVPTVFNANRLSLVELSALSKQLAEKCKQGSIEPDLLKGGTFTVSNLGGFGVEMFTPVLNPPQTGLLGVCSIIERTRNGLFYPAMGLSLTYDHRALDGADAARFHKDLIDYLERFSARFALQSI